MATSHAYVSAPDAAPNAAEIARIAAVQDPVLRNLQITECYWRLSTAVRARVGGGANWCTFATWASRQAGDTIRCEDMAERLAERTITGAAVKRPLDYVWRKLLRKGIFNPYTIPGRLVREINSPFDAFERASDAVARGNRKVFEEIGLEFARFLTEPGWTPDSLKPGPPPEGQDLLRTAFCAYANPTPQSMLLANLAIGLHEQTRLQPKIQSALEAVPDTAADLRSKFFWMIPPAARSFRRIVRRLTREIITESLMVLRCGTLKFQLSRHIDAPCPDVFSTPTEELKALLGRFPHDGPCGAEDWARLDQRMRYIFHLFRAYHFEEGLFAPPFSPQQARAIRAGALPHGAL